MIPIRYFLALLALLSLVTGCSQEQPPQLRLGDKNQITDKADVGSNQTDAGVDDPVVKPQNPKNITQALVISELRLSGRNAEILYQLMAVEPQGAGMLKSGKHVVCGKDEKTGHSCSFLFEAASGDLQAISEELKTATAEKTLDADYDVDGMLLKKDNNMGGFVISTDEAKGIFHSMSNPVATVTLLESADFLPGTRKKGKYIDCEETFRKATPQQALYSCKFWFLDRTTGEMQTIQ